MTKSFVPFLVFVSLLPLFTGCATIMRGFSRGLYIKNVDWPLTEIRGLCNTQLPIGQASMSSNGRELRSNYFYPAKNEYKDGAKATDRYVMHITILGDSRPYDVEVVVSHERKVMRNGSPTYVAAGYDERLTRELRDKLQVELTKRREDRNIIDDFRIY